jgi:hypothetical protein
MKDKLAGLLAMKYCWRKIEIERVFANRYKECVWKSYEHLVTFIFVFSLILHVNMVDLWVRPDKCRKRTYRIKRSLEK